MKQRKTIAKRLGTTLLSVALMLPLLQAMVGSSGDAEAALSLPRVQEMKYSTGTVNILEILPNAEQGVLGYYIAGQEPCADWPQQIAKLSNTANSDNRAAYVGTLFSKLTNAGIMGDGAAAHPLTMTANYSEKYPWELSETEKAEYTPLTLENYETGDTLEGVFSYSDAGEYSLLPENVKLQNEYNDNGKKVPVVQVIGHLKFYSEDPGENLFWYDPRFSEANTGTAQSGTALYERIEGDYYDYAGTVGENNFSPVSGVTYYYVSSFGAPSKHYDGTGIEKCQYAAVDSGFRLATASETNTGFYINSKKLCFEYVGSGGNSAFATTNARDKQLGSIKTNQIFYKGGYVNNDWFLKYVMDWGGAEARPTVQLKVQTVKASEATAAQIASARIIYLASGYVTGGSAQGYTAANDISDEAKAKIREQCIIADGEAKIGKSIIVDSALANSGADLKITELAKELAPAAANEFYVSKNVYRAPALLCSTKSDFYREYEAGLYNNSSAPFYSVYFRLSLDTRYENLGVSIAGTLRHLLNGVGITDDSNKTVLKVLDIEPGKSGELTADTVMDWLGRSGDTNLTVNITTLSTSALIGDITDISEEYDLVYIGAQLSDFATRNDDYGETIRDYYDDGMDGLVYTNIGDLVISGGQSGWGLSGLLDRDFYVPESTVGAWWESFKNMLNNHDYNAIYTGERSFLGIITATSDRARTFRYSGNDLTREKMQELKNLAGADFPIVISDELASPWLEIGNDATSGTVNYFGGRKRNYSATITDVDERSPEKTITAQWTNLSNGSDNISSVKYLWSRIRGGETTALNSENDTAATTSETNVLTIDNIKDGDIYYCKVKPVSTTSVFGFGNLAIDEEDIASIAKSQSVTYHANAFGARVDSSSNMFELLNEIKTNDNKNVMTTDAIDPVLLKYYIEMRHISLDFTKKPVEYSSGESLTINPTSGKYSLDYEFKINVQTTSNIFVDAEYTASLYIDGNGDGLYSDKELMSGISITDSSGAEVDRDKLKKDTAYLLSLSLPDKAVGIIPWKLIVKCNPPVDQNDLDIHFSEQGYTHRIPSEEQKPTISVLQINTDHHLSAWLWEEAVEYDGLDLQANIENGGTFYSLLKEKGLLSEKLAKKLVEENEHYVSGDFKVDVITIKAGDLTSLATSYTGNASLTEHLKDVTVTDLSDIFNSFDMLIIGFDDSYQEIDESSAKAIRDFINTGKAVLFSHDNTSFYSLPRNDFRTNRNLFSDIGSMFTDWGNNYISYVYGDPGLTNSIYARWSNRFPYYGYYFNMAIRDAVGLDRYGVTSNKLLSDGTPIGLTKYTHKSMTKSGLVASQDYLSLTAQQIAELQNEKNCYSIAYEPNTARSKTIGETQGMSNTVLTRFYRKGGYPTNNAYSTSRITTDSISQVNQGRITTYPFDVNTEAFGGNADGGTGKITIGETHAQYYQLNLNSDEIVVWYCLAGGEHDYEPNDVLNSYYIYNRSGITYTGFGHSVSTKDENGNTVVSINETEAKLIINAMVAAYRGFGPSMSFTDETGKKDLESFLIPTDGNTILPGNGEANDPTRMIFFKVEAVGEALDITAGFTFPDSEGSNTDLGLTVYSAENNQAVNTGDKKILPGKVYYIRLDDLIKKLPESGVGSGLVLSGSITVNGITSSDTLSLHTLSLFDLT